MIARVARAPNSPFRLLLGCTLILIGLVLASPLPSDAGTPQGPHPASCKPLPPIDVRILPLDGLAPEGVGRFAVEVTPLVPAREVRVRWLPSSGRLRWVSGDSLASRPAGLESMQRFEVALRVPAHGLETLHCQVEIVTEDGRTWRRGVGVALGPEVVRARGRLAPDGEGGHFVEFEAAIADQREAGSR